MAKRDWCRLAVDWYDDPVIDAAADDAPVVVALWPVLVAMAKRASRDSNPDGVVEVSARQLGKIVRHPEADVEAALRVMVDGELVSVVDAGRGQLHIELVRFGKWQSSRGSAADRKARQRARDASREKASESHGTVTGCHDTVTQTETETETETTPISVAKATSSDSGEPNADHPNAEATIISRVLDYSNAQTGRRLKKTEARRSKVRARLREGFTEDELRTAVDHYAASPFHQGENDRGVRYDSPEVIFRDAGQVEKAVDAGTTTPQPGQQGERQKISTDELLARYGYGKGTT